MAYMTPSGKKPLLITVPVRVHRHIGIAAAVHGMSKSEYVNAVLAAGLMSEPAVTRALAEEMRARIDGTEASAR